MPNQTPDLLDIADQINFARDFVDLIQRAHSHPENSATATAAAHVSDMLKAASDCLIALIEPQTPEAAQ
jgi:hypothetical protein